MSDPARTCAPPGTGGRRRGLHRSRSTAAAIDALQGFCLGDEGRAAARSELRRLGLPTDADHVDDICQAVLTEVWSRLENGDPDADRELHAKILGYARRSVRNAAIDTVRAARPQRLDDLLVPRAGTTDRDDGPAVDQLSHDVDDRSPLPWSDGEADDALAPAVRAATERLHQSRRRLDTWVVSAVLATTHLADHPSLEPWPGTPIPSAKSPAARAGARWAGLAYAGRTDCWTTPETGAVRERRSTALKRLNRTLTEAIELAALATGATGSAAPSDVGAGDGAKAVGR